MQFFIKIIVSVGIFTIAALLGFPSAVDAHRHENSSLEWRSEGSGNPIIRQHLEDGSFRNFTASEETRGFTASVNNSNCPDVVHEFNDDFSSATLQAQRGRKASRGSIVCETEGNVPFRVTDKSVANTNSLSEEDKQFIREALNRGELASSFAWKQREGEDAPVIVQSEGEGSPRTFTADTETGGYTEDGECPDLIHGFGNSYRTATLQPRELNDGECSSSGSSTDINIDDTNFRIGDETNVEEALNESDSGNNNEVECDADFGLSWLICGLIDGMQAFMKFVKNAIETMLTISPLERTDEDGDITPIYSIWSNIRNIANVLLIPIFLFLIFAQATSFNIDTYTVKKMVPRLVAAAILIQASFFIVAIAVDISNVLGVGIDRLMTSVVATEDIQLGATGSNDASAVAADETAFGLVSVGLAILGFIGTTGGVALVAGGWIALFLFMLPAIIAIIITFLTLVLRHIVVIVLAVLSPVAFLLWILPNTEKWFKQWWDALLKALLMFPLIIALMVAGSVVAVISSNMEGNPVEEGMGAIIAFVAVMAPLFIVPLTYKLAGTAMSVVGGTISNLSQRGAYGKDGKGGMVSGLRERKDRRDADIAAGASPENWAGRKIMQTPGLRKAAEVGARPGMGVSRYSRAQAQDNFRRQIAQAGKDLEDSKVSSPETLRGMNHAWGGRKEANKYIENLENEAANRESEGGEENINKAKSIRQTANELKDNLHLAGRNEVQAAALDRLAQMGESKIEDHEAVEKAFEGQPQIGKQVATAAAMAAGKANRPDIKAHYTGTSPEDAVTKLDGESLRSLKDGALKQPRKDEQGNEVKDEQGNTIMDPTDFGQALAKELSKKDSPLRAVGQSALSPASGMSGNTRRALQETFEKTPSVGIAPFRELENEARGVYGSASGGGGSPGGSGGQDINESSDTTFT